METQKTTNRKAILKKEKLKKENGAGGIRLPYFRLCYKATLIKTKHTENINIDQWNMVESLRINPHTYGHLIYDKGGKNIQCKKRQPL